VPIDTKAVGNSLATGNSLPIVVNIIQAAKPVEATMATNTTKSVGSQEATKSANTAVIGTQEAVGTLEDHSGMVLKALSAVRLAIVSKIANIIATKAEFRVEFAPLTVDKLGADSLLGSNMATDIMFIVFPAIMATDIKAIVFPTAVDSMSSNLAIKGIQLAKLEDINMAAAKVARKTFTRFNIMGIEKDLIVGIEKDLVRDVSNFNSEVPICSLVDTARKLDSAISLTAIQQNLKSFLEPKSTISRVYVLTLLKLIKVN
jgi:hypothetical protein